MKYNGHSSENIELHAKMAGLTHYSDMDCQLIIEKIIEKPYFKQDSLKSTCMSFDGRLLRKSKPGYETGGSEFKSW
jgi:hypothetical protein